MKVIAKAVLRKGDCNCGFWHPGEQFEVTEEQGVDLIGKGLAVPAGEVKEEKAAARTKEDKTATKTK